MKHQDHRCSSSEKQGVWATFDGSENRPAVAAVVGLLFLVLSACNGSEVGNPPFQPENPGTPIVAADAVDVTADPVAVGGNILTLPGGRPLVGGRPVEVGVTNLDDDGQSVPMTTQDGAYSVSLSGIRGDVLRFHFGADGDSLTPVDYRLEGGDLVPLIDPLDGCFERERRAVRVGSANEVVDLRFRNRCTEVLSLAPGFRRGADWQLVSSVTDVAPDEVVTFTLAAGDAPGEDTFFLFIQGADGTLRYATSLFAP